jgi:hypothetical protein
LEQPQVITNTINIHEMMEIVEVSLRRASAFLRFGLDELETRDGGDFNLAAGVTYRFWPEVVSVQDRENARAEYRSWLVGSCLRELDLFHSLFLDEVWRAIEISEKHGTKGPAGFKFDTSFARITNVAKKQKLVAEKLGSEDHFGELNSLSLARNALAHNAGVVRSPGDCNSEGRDALEIRWLALDTYAARGSEERRLVTLPFDSEELPGEGAVQFVVSITERVLPFQVDTRISLTHSQIAELCFFYKIIGHKTIEGLVNLLRSKGLVAPLADPNTAEHE